MSRNVGTLATGTALALGLWLVASTGNGSPADDPKTENKTFQATLKIADLMAGNKLDQAKTDAEALAKKVEDIEKVMDIMKLRNREGLGFGAKPIPGAADGLEARLINLGRRVTAADLKNQGAELQRMCEIMAAVAEVAIAKAPTKKMGKKDPKEWLAWSKDMRDSSLALRDAIKSGKAPNDIKELATKLNATCTDCHAVWKEK